VTPAGRLFLVLLGGASLALLGPRTVAAQTSENDAVAGFESAGNLLRKCKESSSYSRNFCYAYLAAVADSARSYRIWIGSGDPCLPAGLTMGRLADTFEAYLIQNPSLTRAQAASVIVASLQENYPCPAPGKTIPLPAPAPAPAEPAPAPALTATAIPAHRSQ
jgi:hypothetical protein